VDTDDSNKLYRAAAVGATTIATGQWELVRDSMVTTAEGWKASGKTTIDGDKIETGTLSASKITTGTLDASLVTVDHLSATKITTGTLDVAGRVTTGAITDSASAYTAAATALTNSSTEYTIQSVAYTTTGGRLVITVSLNVLLTRILTSGAQLRILRGTSEIYACDLFGSEVSGTTAMDCSRPTTIIFSETPAAGTYTYYVKVTPGTTYSSPTNTIANRLLMVEEFKK
jgi:hypothetical protein